MNKNALKKVSVRTVGCRLNQYESEMIAAQLYPYGFTRVEPGEMADLYIINTCTVTHRADSSCRNYIRRASRENPSGRVVVTGCYVENTPETVAALEGVDLIIHNRQKERMAEILADKLPDLFDREPDQNCSVQITDFFDHNRAWIKVSDGCNQRCSYCIIPAVRGPLNNRPPGEIISEINTLVESGYKEVVMTAVHLGHYKHKKSEPFVKNFAELCRMVLAETDLYRLRLASIEPQTIRDELVEVFAEANGRICRNIHASLQSGSSRILKMMRRPYDAATYVKRVSAVKAALDNTIIGADLIVGFPGETDDDFRQSKELAESGLIDYLHVFSYSDRPGTASSKLPDKVNPQIIKERAAILKSLSGKLRRQAQERQVGKVLEVISEHNRTEGGGFSAISDNYIKVKLSDDGDWGKEVLRARITGASEAWVEGELLGPVS